MQLNKSRSFDALIIDVVAHFWLYREICPICLLPNMVERVALANRKLQHVCPGSTVGCWCVGLAAGQCATNVSLFQNVYSH